MVAAFLPLQYGTHRPWVHGVDAEVLLHLLRHAVPERTTGVTAGAARAVNQMPQKWLQDGWRVREQHTEHPFWFAGTTSDNRDAVLHKADWAASQDTILQNTPPDPTTPSSLSQALTTTSSYGPPPMRTPSSVTQQELLGHVSTH